MVDENGHHSQIIGKLGYAALKARSFTACLLAIIVLSTAMFAADTSRVAEDELSSLIKRAEKLTRIGKLDEAERLLKLALVIDSRSTQANIDLALVYAKGRRLREAYDLALKVVKAEPRNARALSVMGLTLLNSGRFVEAKVVLSNALQIDRREDLAWASFGMLDFYENRMSDSVDRLREAVYHEPYEPDYWFALAQVCARSEQYKEAAFAYDRFLAVSDRSDRDRRARIKGLINFLKYLGQKQSLYIATGDKQTSVPIRLVGNRPIIQVTINGSSDPLNFVLDTGSGISVISEKTAKRLNVRPITRGGFAKGIGGDGKFEIVYGFLRRVDIGGIEIRNVPVYIRDFHIGNNEVDGYIGLSLISKFLTTLDYGNLTFSLLKPNMAPAVASEAVSLPLRLTSSGYLSGEVTLEGIDTPLNFIVDTGASVSVISDEVAGLDEAKDFVKGENVRVIGSAGVTENVPSLMLPRVSFGKHSRKSIAAIALDLDLINEGSGFQQAGILGGNFLRNYRLTFDFKNSKVTFVPLSEEN